VEHSNPPAAFYWSRPALSYLPESDGGRLRRPSRLYGVEPPISFFDAAGPLVPGDDDADMVRASSLAGAREHPVSAVLRAWCAEVAQ